MKVVIKETVENLKYIQDIFVEFSEISGLEINDQEPTTDEVLFKFVQDFTLLWVNIDNELKIIDDNFKIRARKIEKKIFLWRKFNISTFDNLSIHKTFMISHLGYLLSMLACPVELLEEMQVNMDMFITRSKYSWVSKK